MVVGMHGAIQHLEIGNNTPERIKYRIENKTLQGCLWIAHRRRNTLNNGFQQFRNPFAGLSTCPQYLTALTAQQLHHFVFHLVGHGSWQVYFVQHRDYGQIVLHRHIEVADGLGLHTLRGIHNEQCSLTCRYGA